jgi:hypothetical protein
MRISLPAAFSKGLYLRSSATSSSNRMCSATWESRIESNVSRALYSLLSNSSGVKASSPRERAYSIAKRL